MIRPNNFVSLNGYVGRDPETKLYAEEKIRAHFSLAIRKSKDQTNWFKITAFGKTAEFVQKYIKKGAAIAVIGSLDPFLYEKDGEKRTGINIIAETVGFLPKNSSAEKPISTAENYLPMTGHEIAAQSNKQQTQIPVERLFDDDDPFKDGTIPF